MTSSGDVTCLLREWSEGNEAALQTLMPIIYGELRRIAARHMAAHRPVNTLQTTALIHEAYLRLAHQSGGQWTNRAHFFGVAAKAMRHILVDHARAQSAQRRGGSAKQCISLEQCDLADLSESQHLVALDEALTTFAALFPRQSQVVELRFFGGFTNQEIADILSISLETVGRDWRAAKAWLYLELRPTSGQCGTH